MNHHAYPPSSEEYRSAQSSNTSLPRYSNNGANNGSNQPSPLNPSTPYRPAPRHPLANAHYVASEAKQQPALPQEEAPQNYRRAPLPTGLAKFYRSFSGQAIADSGKDERHVKLPRLGYLDGLKFIAAWIVLNGTLFDAVLAPTDLTPIQRNSPLYIFRSTNLGITFLLLLSGRSLITPLWDVPPPDPATGKSPSALISWARLTKAMLVRPFRFVLPVLVVVALQWGLGASNAVKDCNAAGMDEPYWGLISNFAGYSTFVFDLFTYYEQDTRAGKTFGANLWTVPWFFQSSYAVYVTHLMVGNLSSNRYWIYAALCVFSWVTYNYFFIAIAGLVLADMHAHGHLHRIRTKWPFYQRALLHVVLIAATLVTQWVPVVRDNINRGLAFINVQDHPELTFSDSIFAISLLVCIETSGLAQRILGNVVMRNLGKLAAGMYLLAPSLVFTIVPTLAISLNNGGSSSANVLGVSWLVLFGAGVMFAALFHVLVELPSKLAGEVVTELLEGADGTGTRRRQLLSKDGKLLKRNVGGGANLGGKARPVLA